MKINLKQFVVYLRVSTKQQGIGGLGLEAQRAAAERYVASVGGIIASEFVEVESGKRIDRPKLAAAIAESRRLGGVLVVAKLDRLARNVKFTSTLMESGVEFIACDMPAANKLTIHIMAALAEDEADRISQRTRDALAAKKSRGEPLGSAIPGHWEKVKDKCGWANMPAERKRDLKLAKLHESFGEVMPLIRSLSSRGESAGKIAEELNGHGYCTPMGAKFTRNTVGRILRKESQLAA